ncbi:MAG TPA: methyl-accepting chemotaxis protein [Anaerolineae bacterium]|nr:methyl-accepting chemotaxis protein [Anaerolineae bacterium]
MSQQERIYKRKNYFIKRDFQSKFILKFCLILLIGTILSTGLLFLFSQGTLTSSFEQSRLVIKNTSLAILPSLIYTNLITLGLITLATIVVTLFVSHKIAGPLLRFEKELKEIEKGDLTKSIKLRKKDQIADLSGSLNTMTAGLHEKVLDIRTGVENLIESASKQNAPQELIEELNHLRQTIEMNFKI